MSTIAVKGYRDIYIIFLDINEKSLLANYPYILIIKTNLIL